MLGHYMSSPGFGMYGNHEYGLGGMASLQDVTRAKFGQPGVDAIVNYPFLVKAQIDDGHYMKEEGTARPASTFSIHSKSDDRAVITGITGREPVSCMGVGGPGGLQGCGVGTSGMFKLYNPNPGMGGMMPLLIGGGIAAAVVIGVVVMKMM